MLEQIRHAGHSKIFKFFIKFSIIDTFCVIT